MKTSELFFIYLFLIFIGCDNRTAKEDKIYKLPGIYPDYTNICIPYNIAPLNFELKGNFDKIEVLLKTKEKEYKFEGSDKIFFPLGKFSSILNESKNDTIWIKVKTYFQKVWTIYDDFYWTVMPEPIDSWLTYRLIEPGYEVWNKISITQRNISNFNETPIADNNLTEGSCMNCHIGNIYNPNQSFFHIRGSKGMTVVANGEKLRKINTKPAGAYSNMIYGNWHPSGRYIAFSNNIVIPSFHSKANQKAFVFDTISDIVVLDIEKNEVLTSPLLSDKEKLETFPEFSSNGRKLYFCSAKKVKLPESHDSLQYSLCSISFDPEQRTFGQVVDTLINGPKTNKTISLPKSSPDGKYIMFTSFSYGTFPLWHNDARIFNYNLLTGKIDTLPELNNNKKYSNSYHSWSSNSRWVIFASKRDNGMYGKPYISYIDKEGKACKPFVLPQKDPEFYDFTYKSFNIPELYQTARMFDAMDIEKLYNSDGECEKVNYASKNLELHVGKQ